jgi:hypothetical protein
MEPTQAVANTYLQNRRKVIQRKLTQLLTVWSMDLIRNCFGGNGDHDQVVLPNMPDLWFGDCPLPLKSQPGARDGYSSVDILVLMTD